MCVCVYEQITRYRDEGVAVYKREILIKPLKLTFFILTLAISSMREREGVVVRLDN